ncbi:hypothetical protein [Variovorax saccharolyticus]|uniref:hypothetical protein n=1 Tax=Variovorax saccharolyticus TaxID=3053516 RepID=UPI00257794BB|nr:hypothetical protein [Variovorax sp. J31P216]MDM0026074.1 hypothetical protein [Variovorax sp. J31P216]
MEPIHQQPAWTDAVEHAGAGASTRGLQKALTALAVAVAALASAVVLVLIPQPIPYASPVPLACSGTGTHESPEVAMARHTSRLSRSIDDIPNSQCA